MPSIHQAEFALKTVMNVLNHRPNNPPWRIVHAVCFSMPRIVGDQEIFEDMEEKMQAVHLGSTP